MPLDTRHSRQSILQDLRSAQASITPENTGDALDPLADGGQLRHASADALRAHFRRVVQAHNTHVATLNASAELPSTVADYMRQLAVGPVVYGGDNPLFNTLSWSGAGLRWSQEAFSDDGQVAISQAECGIADTGTVVLLGSRENPTRNNFLAAHHIVVLRRDLLFAYSEDAWRYLVQRHAKLPRAVNFISGPSSSADVGLKLEYGAHGPRTLAVFLLAG